VILNEILYGVCVCSCFQQLFSLMRNIKGSVATVLKNTINENMWMLIV
jgi:hypothetical protein